MKNEYRLVTFCVESQQLFSGEVGVVRSATLDFLGSVPELAKQMDGWEPVGFQLLPQGETTYIAVMLKQSLTVPDSL